MARRQITGVLAAFLPRNYITLQANTVAGSNALALVVINSGADGEDLFRVAATLGGSSGGEEEPKGPDKMPTVSHSPKGIEAWEPRRGDM